MNEVNVYLEICREDAIIPTYANEGDAGMDVYAAEDVLIEPGETVIVPTGIKFAIPKGYEIQVRPRSGISYKTPLRIANSPGTIDSGYRGELGIIITNTSERNDYPLIEINSDGNKKGTYKIKKGDRIAQIVLQAVPRINFVKVDSVKDIGTDRGGGFGSTGV
ncbi:MAG TPA: dUTP diphosphatase [Ruminiclostridium sp.]|uniref:dUTP diphosphatase n=1 Tax=Acetivibrio saccincola TaxID=1677857 RepID=A0A2S8R8H5_9FIRM|nr:dUTP diphosphatase [Acetivibrio saccincola]HAA43562.1 dUTP diphosphatase [Ruminiclostridium sp.]NLW26967.1 dUTP diphosphatase [Acetivibrio saccincola]PQQ66093.1 aminotransferase [Acetivibrio saccincola]HOA96307.1 dUTP diphosphatase [Acetivibrio saccincola]HQD28955.1 dUTP diphosphatase [Acetivibrio saccincola]